MKKVKKQFSYMPIGRFLIYFVLVIGSIALITIFGILGQSGHEPFFTIFISIGTSLLTSSIFSYLIDTSNGHRQMEVAMNDRQEYLYGFSTTFVRYCYEIIVKFSQFYLPILASLPKKSIKEGIDLVCEAMKKQGSWAHSSKRDTTKGEINFNDLVRETNFFFESLNFYYQNLQKSKDILLLNHLLTETDFCNLGIVFNGIKDLLKCANFMDFGTQLGLMVNSGYEVLEIKNRFDRHIPDLKPDGMLSFSINNILECD
jgi:hypothetical protein